MEENIFNNKNVKKYTQFSKKVVAFCLINLVVIEAFSMWMIFHYGDTSQISYLVTAIAAECFGTVVWYMKNSETEKKARIQAEVDMALHSKTEPDCGPEAVG